MFEVDVDGGEEKEGGLGPVKKEMRGRLLGVVDTGHRDLGARTGSASIMAHLLAPTPKIRQGDGPPLQPVSAYDWRTLKYSDSWL